MSNEWLDECIRLGEVPPHLAEKAKQRLATPEGRLAQEKLAEQDRAILSRLPAVAIRPVPGPIPRLLASLQPRRWRGLALGAAGLAIALFALPSPPEAPHVSRGDSALVRDTTKFATSPVEPESASQDSRTPRGRPAPQEQVAWVEPPHDPGIRTRGSAGLEVLAVGPSGVLDPARSPIPPGTVLRVRSAAHPQAAVWSLDEAGILIRHWPLQGETSAPLPDGPLPRDWQTDTLAGWDRFLLVHGDSRFALPKVEAKLRSLVASGRGKTGRPDLGPALRLEDVVLGRAP